MKKSMLFIFVILAVTLFSCTPVESVANTPQAVSEPTEPMMGIYRIVPYTVDLDAVSETAKRLGMKGEPTESDDRYHWVDGSKSFCVYKDIDFMDYQVELSDDEMQTPLDPMMEEADYVKIAEEFIERYDLWHDDLVREPEVSDLRSISMVDDDGCEKKHVVLKSVHYYQARDDIILNSWSPSLFLIIDHSGEVIKMLRSFFTYEQEGESALIPENVAIKQYLDGEIEAIQPFQDSAVTTVDKCTLVYYVHSDEGWIRPSYRLEGVNAQGDAAMAWILAVEGESLLE